MFKLLLFGDNLPAGKPSIVATLPCTTIAHPKTTRGRVWIGIVFGNKEATGCKELSWKDKCRFKHPPNQAKEFFNEFDDLVKSGGLSADPQGGFKAIPSEKTGNTEHKELVHVMFLSIQKNVNRKM